MAVILLEAPKKAMLFGLTIGYKGLSLIDFSIFISLIFVTTQVVRFTVQRFKGFNP
jgi:hypothetical protein